MTALGLSLLGCGAAFWYAKEQESKRRQSAIDSRTAAVCPLPLHRLQKSKWRVVGGVERWPAKDSVRSCQIVEFGSIDPVSGSLPGSFGFRLAGVLPVVAELEIRPTATDGEQLDAHELQISMKQLPLVVSVPVSCIPADGCGDREPDVHEMAVGDQTSLSRAWMLCKCNEQGKCVATGDVGLRSMQKSLKDNGFATERVWVDYDALTE